MNSAGSSAFATSTIDPTTLRSYDGLLYFYRISLTTLCSLLQEERELFPKDENGKFIYSDVHFMETWKVKHSFIPSLLSVLLIAQYGV